jgi:hypothetical protein
MNEKREDEMGTQFEWDGRYRRAGQVDANAAGEALVQLTQDFGEFLEPEAVIEKAKPKRSPLHSGFEWDDSLAALEHRKHQARDMLKSLRVIVVNAEGEKAPTRVFLNIQQGSEQGYFLTHKVLEEPDLYSTLLQTAQAQLQAWHQRYKELGELSIVHRAIEKALRL